jgi:hypothetical protein
MRTDIQPETLSLRVQFMRFISVQRTHGSYIFPQIYTVLEMGQYLPVYHTGTYFVPEFHTGTYRYILYPFFSHIFWRHILVSLLRSIPALLNFDHPFYIHIRITNSLHDLSMQVNLTEKEKTLSKIELILKYKPEGQRRTHAKMV